MAKYIITRDHINPQSDEHAAMCTLSRQVEGDFHTAKSVMAEMVVEEESPSRIVPLLRGIIDVAYPVNTIGAYGSSWTGAAWTEGDIRWTIREES